MADLPVMLRVAGRRCVVVGGGAVAHRRVKSLHEAGAVVSIIAPQVEEQLLDLADTVARRPYRSGDLDGALLVVIATDDPAVNTEVAADARGGGVLVNQADDPSLGDVMIPAHAHHGPVTLAVHTRGISPTAAGAIRRELSEALDKDWLEILDVIAAFRGLIQSQIAEPKQRRQQIKRLSDDEAIGTFKQGGAEALRRHCQQIVDTLPTLE